ncbi:hypothetical protein ScPMuIL_014109 [Solemya velum]
MSTALVSAFCDFEDVLAQNQKNQMRTAFHMNSDRRINGVKSRNISTGSLAQITNSQAFTNNALISAPTDPIVHNLDTTRDPRRLDRSVSLPGDKSNANQQQQQQQQQQQRQNVNSSRYKTELCRPFEESGHCKYGDKCQFAHGAYELRTLARHPKYKTELCRTFHTIGFCPYGPRCHFIHNEDERKLNILVNNNQQANVVTVNQRPPPPSTNTARQSPTPLHPAQRPQSINFNISAFNEERSSFDSAFDSSSQRSSDSGSSPSMSPTLEDVFSNSHVFSSATHFHQGSTNSSTSSSPVLFNYPAPNFGAALASLVAPLKVRTQQYGDNTSDNDLEQLQQHFDSILNFNQRHNNQSVFGDLEELCAPPSPPESISGDSVGSTSSMGSTGYCPLEIRKGLPIYSRVSHNDKLKLSA